MKNKIKNIQSIIYLVLLCSLNGIFLNQAYAKALVVPDGKISEKTLILIAHTDGANVVIKEAFLKNIPFFKQSNDDTDYHYTLVGSDGQELYKGDSYNPLIRWIDDFSDPNNPQGGKEIMTENEFMLKVPYFSDINKVSFEYDGNSGSPVLLGDALMPLLK